MAAIEAMSAAQRLELIGKIWDTLDPDDVPLTDEQKRELDRRLDDHARDPGGIPWEQVRRELLGEP